MATDWIPYALGFVALLLALFLKLITMYTNGKKIRFGTYFLDSLQIVSGLYLIMYTILVIGFRAFGIEALLPQNDIAFAVALVIGGAYLLNEGGKKYKHIFTKIYSFK